MFRKAGDTARRKELAIALHQALGMLGDLGYEGPDIASKRDPLVGRILTATYRSRERAREVHLQCATRDRHAGRNGATLSVFRLPFRTVDDQFSVNVYIQEHKPELLPEIDRLKDAPLQPAEFMNAMLAIYRDILENDIRDIVEGSRWDERYFVSWT